MNCLRGGFGGVQRLRGSSNGARDSLLIILQGGLAVWEGLQCNGSVKVLKAN
jgi:hypothetical protein